MTRNGDLSTPALVAVTLFAFALWLMGVGA
jgi:hypothetical protein